MVTDKYEYYRRDPGSGHHWCDPLAGDYLHSHGAAYQDGDQYCGCDSGHRVAAQCFWAARFDPDGIAPGETLNEKGTLEEISN